MALACERCSASKGSEYEEQEDTLRLNEVATHFGVLTILCFDCRKAWNKYLNTCDMMKEYSEASFRLEHFRLAHRKSGSGNVEDGLELLRNINKIEDDLCYKLTNWIRAGISKNEKELRGL